MPIKNPPAPPSLPDRSQGSAISLLDELIGSAEIIDLSRVFEPGMPAWPTQARYGSVVFDSWEYGSAALHSQITFSEHSGTHIDAPKHFIPDGAPVDEIPLRALMGRGVTIDVSRIKPRSLLPEEALFDFETREGPIQKGDIVMFRFGWDEKYALQPKAGDYLKDWPGLSERAAEYLARREVKAVGCDTLALDVYDSKDNPAHHLLLEKGILIIENIQNLSRLPAFSYIIGMPLKFKGGSGSPLRLAAIIRRRNHENPV